MTEFVADSGDDSINFGAAIIVLDSRGLVPAIHVFIRIGERKTWMAVTSTAMTAEGAALGMRAARGTRSPVADDAGRSQPLNTVSGRLKNEYMAS
jgi:hypothetical protein